jgi:hypothetical protein
VPGLLEGLLNRGTRPKEGAPRPSSPPRPAPDEGDDTTKRDDRPDDAKPAPAAPADPLKDLLDAVGRQIDGRDKPKEKNRRKPKNDRNAADAPGGSDRISRDPPPSRDR